MIGQRTPGDDLLVERARTRAGAGQQSRRFDDDNHRGHGSLVVQVPPAAVAIPGDVPYPSDSPRYYPVRICTLGPQGPPGTDPDIRPTDAWTTVLNIGTGSPPRGEDGTFLVADETPDGYVVQYDD
jgi:hypothetical protein